MFVGWGILSPISKYAGWAPGPVGDMATGARGWILWVSLAIMCADSLVSLTPVVVEFFVDVIWRKAFSRSDYSSARKENNEVETEDRLVPYRWVYIGWTVSVVLGTFLVWIVFGHEGIKPWATFLGFVLGGMLSVLA
jgi:uncharacterized oligopeptide transporter (OPT) family protein